MTKWEYKTESRPEGLPEDEEHALNEMGREGWELLAVTVSKGAGMSGDYKPNYLRLYWKRRIYEFSTAGDQTREALQKLGVDGYPGNSNPLVAQFQGDYAAVSDPSHTTETYIELGTDPGARGLRSSDEPVTCSHPGCLAAANSMSRAEAHGWEIHPTDRNRYLCPDHRKTPA